MDLFWGFGFRVYGFQSSCYWLQQGGSRRPETPHLYEPYNPPKPSALKPLNLQPYFTDLGFDLHVQDFGSSDIVLSRVVAVITHRNLQTHKNTP